ncbi:hypothetical protein [Flagellimonas onchidii]|uniref:hypothetical protein n=1 Tax=Flagellimonas onchidii TaxID=2562684 RepID=UPI0010A642E4|nr:hypothetical protein [Allomuricauda onchidii]
MRNKILFQLVLVFVVHGLTAQIQMTWEDFADVKFEPKYNATYDVNFLMPTFGKEIKSYRGQEVQIKGYFLDISGSGEVFLVSANPMASCFFCGAAGPETIIEVDFKEKPPFRTDQIVVVTGVLELNANNVDRCNYILNEATGRLIE